MCMYIYIYRERERERYVSLSIYVCIYIYIYTHTALLDRRLSVPTAWTYGYLVLYCTSAPYAHSHTTSAHAEGHPCYDL